MVMSENSVFLREFLNPQAAKCLQKSFLFLNSWIKWIVGRPAYA